MHNNGETTLTRLAAQWRAEAEELRKAANEVKYRKPGTAVRAEAGALVYDTCASALETVLRNGAAASGPSQQHDNNQ